MRLRTQFIITMLLFSAILVVIAASAITTNRQVEKVMEQERRAVDIARGADEIGYLANDYLIYREDLQLKRWQKKFASFTELVAGLHVDRAEQQALVANIQANQNRLKEVFDSVASAQRSLSRNQNAAFDPASLRVSWSRMAVQSQALVSDASRLSYLLHQQRDELTHKRTMLIRVMMGLFGVFLLVSYMQTYRRILKSIVTLRDSAAVVGSGNLDFVIEETKNDEIGELSRAFNKMTTDLKAVTTSKADMEKEITERKRIENELWQKEAELREAQRIAHVGSWYWDAKTDATTGSDELLRIYGFDQTTQLMPAFREQKGQCYTGEDWERVNAAVQRTLQTGVGYELDVQAIRDGAPIWVTTRGEVVRDADGRIAGLRGTVQEITERKRAEEAVRRSEAMLRALLDQMPSGVTVRDARTGALILSNARSREILGALVDIPEQFAQYRGFRPDGSPYLNEEWPVSRSMATGEVVDAEEIECERIDGTRITLSISSAPIRDSQGRIVIGVGVFHDITERKKTEQALAEHAARLEEANKELESFSYSVSHDLRAPLRAIDGYTRSILKKAGDRFDEETTRKFNEIRSNSQMMGQLIDDILTLSRLGRKKMTTVMLDMDGIIHNVWKELQSINTERTMILTVHSMPLGYGDLTLIKQVYSNLLANAVKFTKNRDEARIEVGGKADGNENVYYVKDNGVGFDMAYYDKLFGIFQRLHNDEFEGTGVGLATVQRIVHRHGGRV